MAGIRRYVTSIITVLAIVGGVVAATIALKLEPRLGLDLRGGLSMTLTAPEGTRPDVLDQTVEVLRNRVDRAGVAEPEISQEGSTNVLVQLPGTEDPQRLLQLIGRTAQLQFRQVKEVLVEGQPGFEEMQVSESDDPTAEVVLPSVEGDTKYSLNLAELTGDAVRVADAVTDPTTGAVSVEVAFKSDGSRKWGEFTGRLACLQGPERQIAIVLDGLVESAPQVDPEVECNTGITGGRTVITGGDPGFTLQEAKDLALVLTTGALPVELERSEVRIVSPTLGRDSLRAGLLAGALGLALVMLYVLVYYRSLGLQTWLGLAVFGTLIYGLILLFGELVGWSLTLAGIAGLIVSIGIATDSYIVFFERVKEEVHAGKTLRSSMDRGFSHAWKTLRAANAVTILAAVVLYLLAVGPVRGFALALGMATILDLGLFATFTWPVAALLARNRFFAEGRFIGMRRALEGTGQRSLLRKIYRSEFNFDFVGRRRSWLVISAVVIVVAGVVLIPSVRGLEFGIDFKGGAIFRAAVDQKVSVQKVRTAMAEAGQSEAVVQLLEDPTTNRRQIQVQTPALDPKAQESVQKALADSTGASASAVDFEQVGEKWGQQITRKALQGLVIFLVLLTIYLSLRLEPKMAGAAMTALMHDLIVTAGIYAIVGFKVSPASVIALLTILGYSLYDTVVVFDKIRENTGLTSNARRSFAEIANDSMNTVLMRSISTSLMTLLPVGSLLFVGSFLLGAETLKDLALALFVGIAASTYSSIFVATQVLSYWKQGEARYASARTRVLREAVAARGIPSPEPRDEADESEEKEYAGLITQPPPRPGVRVQQKKQSRRKRKQSRR